MSLASRAVNRLDELYQYVLTRIDRHEARLVNPLVKYNMPIATLELLEPRLLMSGDITASAVQVPLPTQIGQTFVVEDYDNKVTKTDLGFNYFMGNTGEVENIATTTTTTLSVTSNGSTGGSLDIDFDFSGQPPVGPYGGVFHSLFGLTDTYVSLNGDGQQPEGTTPFPGYFLNRQDVFRGLPGYENRSIEMLQFDLRVESAQPIVLKIELKDESGVDVYTRRAFLNGGWATCSLSVPSDFTDSITLGGVASFDWNKLSVLSLIVERSFGGSELNSTSGEFLLDNIRLVDSDGLYPDYDAMRDIATGSLQEQYTDAFLEEVRKLSFMYFRDFASTDTRTGGMILDRSNFADLITVGGTGFQLSAYVVGAQRSYMTRAEAAARTRAILEVLYNEDGQHPMGSGRVGTIGHNGFFYHFVGIDGLRKQNFDFAATTGIDESKNTVEVSVIDTALLVAGALTSAQYFTGSSADEVAIRSLAQSIYERVDWTFMYHNDSNQFYLGWKPNETRYNDDVHGRFLLNDALGQGQYSSKLEGGIEVPATLDYYTDEAALIALLATSSPTHPVSINAFYGPHRMLEDGFVKTYPGSLFTYQFGGIWLDTRALNSDSGSPPIDYYLNTQAALNITRQYAIENPLNRATWQDGRGQWLWGLSACEGPFDQYFADAAPDAAIASNRPVGAPVVYEAEHGTGDGVTHFRSNASNVRAVWLHEGESRTISIQADAFVQGFFRVQYSNDSYLGPLDTVELYLDGDFVGAFQAQDTGDGAAGWNVFATTDWFGGFDLSPGSHMLTLLVTETDEYAVEIDKIDFIQYLPLETGTVTSYAVSGAMPFMPDVAAESLWRITQQDLNADGSPELLHPRFGFADAFNFDVAAASPLAPVDALRTSGAWANFTGFAIDHGPALLLLDSYLGATFNDRFNEALIPKLFMSNPDIHNTLTQLFNWPHPGDTDADSDVDFDDFLAVYNFFGEPGPGSPGDADTDGDCDFDDFLAVNNFFGFVSPGLNSESEPMISTVLDDHAVTTSADYAGEPIELMSQAVLATAADDYGGVVQEGWTQSNSQVAVTPHVLWTPAAATKRVVLALYAGNRESADQHEGTVGSGLNWIRNDWRNGLRMRAGVGDHEADELVDVLEWVDLTRRRATFLGEGAAA